MRHRPHLALLGALGCAILAVLVWAFAFHSGLGRWLDAATLQGFTGLRGGRTAPVAQAIADLCDPLPFALFVAAIAYIALARGRVRVAALVVVAPWCAAITTQLLKPALAAPRHHDFLVDGQIADAAWPSGHTTAAMSLALALVIAVPSRHRPLAAAVGGVFTVGVVYSIMLLGWHYPSDVLGGFAVAAGWTFLGIAAVSAAERRHPAGTSERIRSLHAPAAAAVALAALAGGLFLARSDDVIAYAQAHTIFVVAAAAIAAAALAISATVAALLRH